MSWSLIDKPRTVRVTKSLAKEFAEMEAPPHDRPLSERRMMIYRRMFNDGLFRPVTWAKCLCKDINATYRINGKHTSILLSSMESIPEFYVTIESYQADDLEDVARLYSTFDTQVQLRTARDINRSFAASVAELRDMPANIINVAVTGISYARNLEMTYSLTPAERAELLLDHVEFVVWLHDIISIQTVSPKFLHRGAVVSAMLMTYDKNHKAATEFWTAVRDETGQTPDLPDRKLAKWLSQFNVNFGGGAQKPRTRKAENKEFLARALHAWNAWRKGKSTELRYYPDAEIPAAV
jgi:hypothetical protein